MENPIAINSDNVTQFGFKALFKLGLKQLVIDITDITEFAGAGEIESIIFKVTDPTGVIIDEFELTGPDYDPYTINLSSIFGFGFYTIEGVLTDSDDKVYSVKVTKDICEPSGWDKNTLPGKFDIAVDCRTPRVRISETSVLTYKGKSPVSKIVDGVVYYPDGLVDNIPFNFTPFTFGSEGIYTGNYTLRNITTATFDMGDGIFVEIPYSARTSFNVECTTGLRDILCCIEKEQDAAQQYAFSAKGENANKKLQQIGIPLLMASFKEATGVDATGEINTIKKILNCDCGCGKGAGKALEPSLITGGSVKNYTITGTGATTHSVSTVGDTVAYTIHSKNVIVSKGVPNDLAFSIVKTENDNQKVYAISFNYSVLSETILNTIKNSDELTNLFNSLIEDVSFSINTGAMDGKCVINFDSCGYSLVESSVNPKTVVSIVINGNTYTAPGGLSITQAVSFASWLNGLSLGTFTVVYDNINKKVTVSSVGNENVVGVLNLLSGSTPIVRQFSKTCGSIETILQAIIDYVCALSTMQVKMGQELVMCVMASNGSISQQAFTTSHTLQSYLKAVNDNMCTLANKIASVSSIDCAKIKSIFPHSTDLIGESDGVYGTKNNSCAIILIDELAEKILTRISEKQTLKDIMCEITSTCSIPVCEPPTNVSAELCFGPDCSPIEEIEGGGE